MNEEKLYQKKFGLEEKGKEDLEIRGYKK
jgi:hypothetical protein